MVKHYTDAQVDSMIKMKFGSLVDSNHNISYVSNARLGKLFKCSASKIRQLYMRRFDDLRGQQSQKHHVVRQRYGLRYITQESQDHIIDRETL